MNDSTPTGRYRKWTVTSALAAAFLLSSAHAAAKPTDAKPTDAKLGTERQEAADVLFFQGKELLKAGNLVAACKRFSASAKLMPGVGALLYLGDCFERTDRFASARAAFQQAEQLALTRRDKRRAGIAAVRGTALDARVPKLRLLTGQSLPTGFALALNGVPLSQVEGTQLQSLDAGDVSVEASAPGYQTWNMRVTLRNDADTVVLRVPRLALTTRVSSAEAAQETDSSNLETWGWVLSATAVASLGASAYFSFSALRKNDDANCSDGLCASPADVNQVEDAESEARLATIFGVGGLVLGVGGVSLIVVAPSGDGGVGYLGVKGAF